MATRGDKLEKKHIDALANLKTNIKDVFKPEYDDDYLLRFLRARSYDVKKTETMFRDNLDWRKKIGADDILSWKPPEVILKYYPGGFHGVDKEGFPIWINILGRMDVKGMVYSTTKKEIIKYRVYWMENFFRNIFPELSKKHGKKIDQCNMIFDMDGIGMKDLWKPALDIQLEILRLLEANYPETLRLSFIVNAPSIFPTIWSIVKPFLHEYTRTKVKVLSRGWKDVLLKHIDADQIPKHWGGTATDPDGNPYCKSKVCMGGTIPDEYKSATVLEKIDLSNYVQTNIARSGCLELELEAIKPNSLIRWTFWTEGKDISFGIYFKTKEDKQKISEMEVIVPPERVNSHLVPESDSVTATKVGKYIIQFNNSYSWMHTKKIFYALDVFPPDETMEEVLITNL